MMHCLAVDDEQLVLDLMEDNIRQVPFLELVKVCKNALEASAILQTEKIDLIFLDIQMPKLNGLQFIQSFPKPPMIILVTAYEQYALEGFNLQVVDYLLKPVSFDRFLKACHRAYERYQLQTNQAIASKPDIPDFFVHVEYTMVKVAVADITYVEGLKDYIKIHLSSSPKPIITRMSIKAIEEKLPSPTFVRTHKSFLVAAEKITTVKRDFVCIGNTEVPFSEFYKDNINRILNRPAE